MIKNLNIPLSEEDLNEHDILWLKHYFARPITLPHATLGRTNKKIPIVVRMSIFGINGPCPTIYWLVEPELNRVISRLEATGAIKQLEERLASDQDAFELLCSQHSRYKKLRSELCTYDERAELEKVGITDPKDLGGIAGIKDYRFIKCLHTHFAHYLATDDNIIGAWIAPKVDEMLSV